MVIAACAYWMVLLDSHRYIQRYTREQAWLRVAQTSRAVSEQVGAMLTGLDYTLRDIAGDYESGDRDAFHRAVASVQDTYPSGTIVQLSVADAQGRVVYSSLDMAQVAGPAISILDREHFQAHLTGAAKGLFVGSPVQGRVSGQWSIQLSRALHHEGKFSGVLVLSLSPRYISQQLRAIVENQRDVIMLLREDGTYLARSQSQDTVLGGKVPEQRLALFTGRRSHGTYEAQAGPDGLWRMYAWSRVSGFPLVVSMGLDRQSIQGPLDEAVRHSVWRNALGTAVIFLGGLLTAWLARQRGREEEQRKQNERRFMDLAQEVPGGLFQFSVDSKGRHALPFANPGFYAMHCLDPSGKNADLASLAQRVHADDLSALTASIAQAIGAQGHWAHRYRVNCTDGVVHWLHGHARPQRESDGTVVWHGHILDVTQDEALQQALRQSEERLRLTIGAVRDGMWQWDCAKDCVLWDGRCHEMLGLPQQSLGTFSLADFIARLHPLDRQRVQDSLEQHLRQGTEFRVEMRLRQADGHWRWVESRGEVTQRDRDGHPLRMMGTHTDIHERVEQTRMVSALLDRGSALVLMASPRREIVYANERAAAYFGIPAGRMQPLRSFSELHASDVSFESFAELYKLLRMDGAVRTEWALRTHDGSLRWCDMQGVLLDPQDPDGNVIWTLFDVDARHRAETELAQVQQRMEAVIERFPSGLLVTDAAGQRIVATNQMLVSVLGLPMAARALVGEPVQALARYLPAAVAQAVEAQAGPGPYPARQYHRTVHALPDGRHIETEQLPLRKDSRLLGQCWVLHDVTDYKQRESQLEALASTDPLTGARNRRAFMERMEAELERLRMGMGSACSLIMLDIDHFKRVNDTHGHAVGDEVLKQLVATVSRQLRKDDLLGRLGGEEFAVLLAGADEKTSVQRAEALRLAVQQLSVTVPGHPPIRFTVSLGICALAMGDGSVTRCLERADAAMYHSKHTGRNRTTCWTPSLAIGQPQ
ncbi:Probable diguanylate cyclase YdaM [Delftia tsuruhatensis]|nr:Probable diguanylate cyclase YdaM [Delftia tsuruhatensis]CAC9687042.1 Probable diguanylate cyclase YdaM [Delftia tsuruhatensis]